MSHPSRISLILMAWLWPLAALKAQVVLPWQDSYHADSSYYEVAQVGPGTWWVGGENGILYAVKADGAREALRLPGPAVNILKIRRWGEHVFVAGDQGTVFRYDLQTGRWTRRSLGGRYARMSFYDLMILPETGMLVLVGGHQEIAKGHLAPPRGLMIRLPVTLAGVPERVWQRPGRFVWAIRRGLTPGELVAVAFNGVHSRLWTSQDGGQTFAPGARIPGLVHHLMVHEGHIWYSGARDLRFRREGILGRVGEPPLRLPDVGCVWSILPQPGACLALTQAGTVLRWDAAAPTAEPVAHIPGPVYEGAALDAGRWLLVGHGRRLFQLTLDPAATAAR